MTREEAIELLDILPLCNECDSNNFPYTCVECGDAFLLSMEALKQPEVVRCKDCIYWKNGYMKYDVHPWLPCMEIKTDKNWFCADGRKQDDME